MSDLVFIAFPTEEKAELVRQKVLALQREYLIELGDAVVVVKIDKGQIGWLCQPPVSAPFSKGATGLGNTV